MNGLEEYVFWNDWICCNIRIGIFCSDDSAIVPFDRLSNGWGLVRHGQPWIRIPNFTCKSMDSQGANRKLGSRILGKDWSCIVDISIVPFPYWYHFLILIVKIHVHYWTQAKSVHKFLGVFCASPRVAPFYPRCQGDVWSLSLGMAWRKPCTQLGSLDWLNHTGVDTRWVLGCSLFFSDTRQVNKDFPENFHGNNANQHSSAG